MSKYRFRRTIYVQATINGKRKFHAVGSVNKDGKVIIYEKEFIEIEWPLDDQTAPHLPVSEANETGEKGRGGPKPPFPS